MAIMSDKVKVLHFISMQNVPVSMRAIKSAVNFLVSDRTVRRWLNEASSQGKLTVQGEKRTTTYLPTPEGREKTLFKFLEGKTKSRQEETLKLLRDFWTHHSTALEGNTLTLGDTQFILDEGLTISGKPIKEHQEIIGHASAISLIYKMIDAGVSKQSFFDLHKAVQSEIIHDIEKPYGAWKVEPNGTRVIGDNDKPVYLEYAHPRDVNSLMNLVVAFINSSTQSESVEEAVNAYVKIHIAVAHIHPFWDGNGRIARLIANIPLLRAGLPPIVIPSEKRREYIQLLSRYELITGKLTPGSGLWPNEALLNDFEVFCHQCYQQTVDIIDI